MKCPRCSDALKRETYEGVQIDRCHQCQGTWLDEGELVLILDRRQEKCGDDLIAETMNLAFAGVPEGERLSVELCPKCFSKMQPLNFAYNSGIVIDCCPDSHGIWLDGKEIEKVQAHHELWQQDSGESMRKWMDLLKLVVRVGRE